MATSEEYLGHVLDLLGDLEQIRYRKMMGEYVLYYRDRVFGGIYDERFLIKPTDSARRLLPDAPFELNYEGGRELLLVDTEDRSLVARVVEAMWSELPAPKAKKK